MSLMAFLYNTPAGVVGSVSRPLESFVDSVETSGFANYGVFGEFTNGVFVPVSGSTTAVDGLLVRSVPSITGSLTAAFNQMTPNADYVQGRMTRGYAVVTCAAGTPAKGGKVYVRIAASTGKAIGDIVTAAENNGATPPVATTIEVTGAEWAANGKDGSNIAEILIKG